MAGGGIASTKPPLTPSAAWNKSRLQPLYAVGRTVSLAHQKLRSREPSALCEGKDRSTPLPVAGPRFSRVAVAIPDITPLGSGRRTVLPRRPPMWMGGTPSIRVFDVGKPLLQKEGRYTIPPFSSPYYFTQVPKNQIFQEPLPIMTSI